jgi:vitamin B12 transporter
LKYLFLLGCSLVVSVPAMAGEADNDGQQPDITVVATGSKIPVSWSGQSISVMGDEEIRSLQGADLTRILNRLPGITLARNGGIGSTTSVFVRGASSEQLLVTIDGIRVADVASPGGGYDFGGLVSGGIGKIELLRGSNSVIWGSDAIGGVMAVSSRELNGAEASAEYGTHNSVDLEATAGVIRGESNATISAGYIRTDGISAASAGIEPDPFRQWFVSGHGRLKLANNLSLVAAGRYADSKVAFDSFLFVDDAEYQTSKQASGRVGLDYNAGEVSLTGGIALANTTRSYFDPAFGPASSFDAHGRSLRADFSGHVPLPSNFAVDFGADSEWSRYSTTFDTRQTARLASGHALLGYNGARLNLAAGVRADDHSRFGIHWTFGANASYRITGDWRIRASYGEGFKAPTLAELYGFGGNLALKPETSSSYDAGIEKGDRNAGFHLAATYFNRTTTNLISYIFPSGYFNTGKAHAEGFELEGDVHPTDRLTIRAAYSYVKSVNRTLGNVNFGKDLARRPRNALSVAADWRTPLLDLTVGGDLRVVSASFDNASNTVRLGGYALVTLRASLPVTDRIELFGRIENLGDVGYQTAAGYGTAGRSAYIGARARF